MTEPGWEQIKLFRRRPGTISFFRLVTHGLVVLCLTGAYTAPADQDALGIVKASLLKGGDSYEPDPRYVFTIHKTESELDRSGNATLLNTETFEAMSLYGWRYEKLVARNNKPLSETESAAENRKLDKQTSEWRLHPQGDPREDKGRQQRNNA